MKEQGGTAADRSGYNNTGNIAGAVWKCAVGDTVTGKGCALYFDGVDDYVNCGGLTPPIESWTQELWLNTTVASKMPMTIGDASIYINYGIAWSGNTWYPGFTSVSDGKWHHLVATYDKSSNAVKIYIDGKLDVEGNKNWGTVQSPILIGAGTWGGWPNYNFKGTIDEVRIYSQALSAGEIQKLYAEGLEKHSLVSSE